MAEDETDADETDAERSIGPAGVPASADERSGPADERSGPAGLGSAYWRMWTAAGLSSLADGIVKVALPLVAIDFTRSPTLIAGLTFAFTLPWLLFALHAGAISDRLDRRRAMLGANIARGLFLAVLVTVTALGGGSIGVLYAIAIGVGVAETIYDTSAQSILPQIVSRELLPRANGRLYAAELTANQFAGPPLAGLLAATGAVVAFATPVGLWALAVAALLALRGRFRIERQTHKSLRADIAEGLRFLWQNKLLRTLAAMVGVSNFATNATMAIFVLFAVGRASEMGLSKPAFGVLLATTAAGSVAGSFLAERVVKVIGRARGLALTILGGALLVGLPAVTANPWLIAACYFVGGAAFVIWNIVTVSLRQRITPDRLLGRVNSCYRLIAWGTIPLGAAAGGLLAQFAGLRATFAIMALLTLTLLFGLRIATDERMDAAEREADLASSNEPEPASKRR